MLREPLFVFGKLGLALKSLLVSGPEQSDDDDEVHDAEHSEADADHVSGQHHLDALHVVVAHKELEHRQVEGITEQQGDGGVQTAGEEKR